MKSKNPIIPGDLVTTITSFNKRLEFAGLVGNSIHIDVVDKGFAEGKSLKVESWPVINIDYSEAHLMVKEPIGYFPLLKEKKITRAIVHVESVFSLDDLQFAARQNDILLGFAVNPDTDLNRVKPFLAVSNYVQVMGIYPGRTGQPYLGQTPLAVSYFRNLHQRLTVTVDGGVSIDNIPELSRAGADYFVASSSIYDQGNWADNYQHLLEIAQG